MSNMSFSLKISLSYLTLGVLWIILSDYSVVYFLSPENILQLSEFQNYKGILYVFISSLFLYIICNYFIKKQDEYTKQSLADSERLKNIINSITDGFFAIDNTWKITHINDVCAKLFGNNKEYFIDKELWKLFPDYTSTKSYKEYHKALNEKTPVHFEDYLAPNDIWFQVSAYPLKNGLAVHFKNITEQKKSQKEIALGKKNLDALINNTNDLIWSIDNNFNFLSFNKAYEEMLKIFNVNYKLKTGDCAIFQTQGKEEISNEWKNHYNRALKGERFTIIYRAEYNNHEFHTETNLNPIYDENNNVIGVGCFSKDITERKKNEDERNRLLQKLVNQNKELEEFSFIASHNLRAPVASIMGLIQLYDKENPNNDLNKTIIENLNITARNLDGVIIDLAQIIDIRHNIEDAKEQINIEEILSSVMSMLSQQITNSKAEFIIHLEAKTIYSIRSYINNIFFNLISNALKYCKAATHPTIEISTKIQEDNIVFEIKDNGIGIDLEKHRSKIFMPYKRFHSHVSGKGIGLYLAKSQAEALAGTIDVESEVDKGSIFRVVIKNK